MSLQDRLESLERTVANLARDLSALRTAVDRLANERDASSTSDAAAKQPGSTVVASVESISISTVSALPPPADPLPRQSDVAGPAEAAADVPPRIHRSAPPKPRRTTDLEALIGRYGTLALASLTILLGAGAFLSWAIANGKITPTMRVFLGALGAGAVAAVGWRLRFRGSKRFGSTLLALALALVHVDAWGAGPYLGLVPSPVALSVAAAAWIALAVLAWMNDEEALFSVGVGGALLAPFVTAREPGSAVALLIYGYIVIATGLVALRGRPWRTAVTVITIGCWLYVAAAHGTISRAAPVAVRDQPGAFAIAVAWTAILVTRGSWGARIAGSAIVALLGTLIARAFTTTHATDLLALAVFGTVTVYAAVHIGVASDAMPSRRQPLFTGALLPLMLGLVAVIAAPDTVLARTVVALGWTMMAVVGAMLQPGARPVHLMVAGMASGAAIVFALEHRAVASCVALAAHAAALSALMRRMRTRLISVPIALGLAIATGWVFQQLTDRPLYGYTPFFTAPSLAALAVSAAWLVVSWNAYRTDLLDAGHGSAEARTAVRLAGSVVTFLWGHTELGRAYSADISTFLLILYYATVGVAAIFVGRAREIRVLRHVGLGLAIFAALKAIAEASSLEIGFRVGSYLLAGLFLLAVAYWYREVAGRRESVPPDAREGSEPSF